MAGIGVAAITRCSAPRRRSATRRCADKMSARTGVSVEALRARLRGRPLRHGHGDAGERPPRYAEDADGGVTRVRKGRTRALARLGLTVQDLAKLSPTSSSSCWPIGSPRSKTRSPGRDGDGALRQGRDQAPAAHGRRAAGINEMQEQARKLGLTVSTETARDAAELNDALGHALEGPQAGRVFTIGGRSHPPSRT